MTEHLVGIIPITTQPMGFDFEWHDCLMPIAPNYYAVERAVLECAYAGCKTIWLVANDDVSPLVRHRLGDFVQDPVWLNRKSMFPSTKRTPIPIFYVPIPPEHSNKEYSIVWSILQGAMTASDIGGSLSKWVSPTKYFVSFPYSVYPPDFLRPHRLSLRNDENVVLSHKGCSMRTNDLLGFTFTDEQYQQVLDDFRKTENNLLLGQNVENDKKYYKTKFALDNTFGRVIIDVDNAIEVPWFYSIESWGQYCKYLSSEEKDEMRHPGFLVMSYREFNPIGVDNDNND